jgi:aspartyl-tRNA(Asn)/glutamyl-tRNA(Gln) amidotransferase subunit A
LARYDGIHFGQRSEHATDLESTYKLSRTEGFGKEVKRRIMLGTYVLSAGFYDAYYTKGQKVRRLIKEKTDNVFNEYDFILSPTSPHTPFDIGKQNDNQIKMYLEDIYTAQAPLAGIPAISLPLGKHTNGLPYGIQVMGKSFGEVDLLAFSKYLMDNNTSKNNV